MFKTIIALSSLLIITGCVTRSGNCTNHVERDLTVAWNERTYWCAPSSYKNAPIKHSVQTSQSKAKFQRSAQPIVDYSVAAKSLHSNNNIRFYRHDTNYSKEDLNNILAITTPIKVRGCRLASEPSHLNFGRALQVRNALLALGFKHKVTILRDVSCIGEQSVEVRS